MFTFAPQSVQRPLDHSVDADAIALRERAVMHECLNMLAHGNTRGVVLTLLLAPVVAWRLSSQAAGEAWWVEAPKQCPSAEVERMMKLQEVFLKAMAKKIT